MLSTLKHSEALPGTLLELDSTHESMFGASALRVLPAAICGPHRHYKALHQCFIGPRRTESGDFGVFGGSP